MGQNRNKSKNCPTNKESEEKTSEPEHNILLSDAYSFAVPNQKFSELVSKALPGWYEHVRSIAREDQNLASEFSSLVSLRSFAEGNLLQQEFFTSTFI